MDNEFKPILLNQDYKHSIENNQLISRGSLFFLLRGHIVPSIKSICYTKDKNLIYQTYWVDF